jgi:hypothetical protein
VPPVGSQFGWQKRASLGLGDAFLDRRDLGASYSVKAKSSLNVKYEVVDRNLRKGATDYTTGDVIQFSEEEDQKGLPQALLSAGAIRVADDEALPE